MGTWLALLAEAVRPPLWLDDTAYGARLLAGGSPPWLDVSALVSWRRKVQGLLKPSVSVLDVAPLADAWIDANPSVRQAMSAQRRGTAPLRALLSEEGLRLHIKEVLAGLRASSSAPLALGSPSPRKWIRRAYQTAFAEHLTPGEDETDSAAVYLADFLRVFGESSIDVLLLEDDVETAPADSQQVGWYQSVLNLARHYRWDVGLRVPQVPQGESLLDFLIAARDAKGVEVDAAFWSGGGAAPHVPPGGFRYAAIPVDAEPEAVLERLAKLR
jgi:hypothetical protein